MVNERVTGAVPPEQRKALWDRVQSEAPEMAEFMKAMQAEFGRVVVTHVQVGELQYGETAKPEDLYPVVSAYDHERAMLDWESTIRYRDAKEQRKHLAKLAKAEAKQAKKGK